MTNSITSLVFAAATALTTLTTGCVIVDDNNDSSLLVVNQSDFTIYELYVTPIGNQSWGPNLLGGDVLFPNESINLGIECGTYDALLVDETNAMCEVNNLDLCFDDADWIIRNNSCAVFEARAKEMLDKKNLEAADKVDNSTSSTVEK